MSEQNLKPSQSEKMVTPVGRVKACHFDICEEDCFGSEKKNYDGLDQNTYPITLLFLKTDPLVKAFILKLKDAEVKIKISAFGKDLKTKHSLITDGDETDKELQHGHWVFRAKARAAHGKALPLILQDRDGSLANVNTFYSGCYARAQVILKSYIYKNDKGVVMDKGVTAKLLVVQFSRDGDPLFANAVKGDQFEAIEEYDAESSDNLLGDAA